MTKISIDPQGDSALMAKLKATAKEHAKVTQAQTAEFKLSPALGNLVSGVQTMVQKHTKFDFGALILNFPLAFVTMGALTLSTEDKSALSNTPMPDEWLAAAAELPTASASALRRLQSDVAKVGYASIEAADRFCAVEITREQKASDLARVQANVVRSTGAALLAKRVEALGIEATFEDALAMGKRYAADIADAGVGAAAFALEKAVWAGKSLGAIAGVMSGIRKS